MKKNGIIAAFIIVILGVMGWNVYQHNQSSEQSAQPKSSSSKKQSAKVDRNTNKKDKILIVYFSRAGQNYGGSNLKIGNTHRIANYIAARTGGDKYEIVPAKKYPTTYQATADQFENLSRILLLDILFLRLPNCHQNLIHRGSQKVQLVYLSSQRVLKRS